MAVEKWPNTWHYNCADGPATQYASRVQEINLGNGYKQVYEDGPNAETRTFTIGFVGNELNDFAKPSTVRDFLRRHYVKPFDFTPPDGIRGLFRVQKDSVQYTPHGGNIFSVTATIETAIGAF